MKNILFKILPLLAAVLFATSCSKDDGNDNSVVPEPTNPSVSPASTETTDVTNTPQVVYDEKGVPSIPFSITVGRDDSESLSKYYYADDYGIGHYFSYGDKLIIKGKNIEGELIAELDQYSPGTTNVTFSGSLWGEGVTTISEDTELEATLVDKDNKLRDKALDEPTVCESVAKAFLNCGYLTTKFNYSATNTSTAVSLKQSTSALVFDLGYRAKVFIKVGNTTYPFTVGGPWYGKTVIAVPDGATVYSSFLSSKEAKGSKIYNIKRSLPAHCSESAFSVGAEQQVLFTKSNLRCRMTAGAYRFGVLDDEPWAIANPSDINVGENHAAVEWWDLFGWGSWLNVSGSHPESTSTTYSDYQWTGNEHAEASYNTDNGPWYVLNKDEWDYLLNKRVMPNPGDARYTRVTMQTPDATMKVKGLIIFPDDFSSSKANLKDIFYCEEEFKGEAAGFDDNLMGAESWELFAKNTMGSIFLPSAGYRGGTKINYYGDGFYWTSSKGDNDNSAYGLYILNNNIVISSGQAESNKTNGCFVRLVHDLK